MARPRSDIEPRIIHAARRRFLEDGVDGASLRNIARDAGTNIGMIYYYFPTKDDLFLAVVEEIYSKFLAHLEEAIEHESSFDARVASIYARIGALGADELDVMRLVVRESICSSARLERLIERFKRGHIGLMLRAVADGIGSGQLDPKFHPAVMVMSTLALGIAPQMIRRIAAERMAFLGLPDGPAFAQQLVEVLLHGIARPAPPPENPS
ncbi:MAG: TetR/AcrR family transcriptional regulator [Polyangiaceae bacterium]|nr:TetR/AcrR family transcriptional regulator [Polyangiaceae bacterium]